jgi:hypothetical protein
MSAAEAYFGSWGKALYAAGIGPRRHVSYIAHKGKFAVIR